MVVLAETYPLIAYLDYDNWLLKAAIGVEPPSGPAYFEFYSVAAGDGIDLFPVVAASVAGLPAIAYWDDSRGAVMLVWWRELYPAAAGDWPCFIVEDGLGEVEGLSLADLGGMPALTYVDRDANVLKFARLVES